MLVLHLHNPFSPIKKSSGVLKNGNESRIQITVTQSQSKSHKSILYSWCNIENISCVENEFENEWNFTILWKY